MKTTSDRYKCHHFELHGLIRTALSLVAWILSFSLLNGQESSPAQKLFVLAGDSTVTDDAGWGIGFAELMTEQARCINMAKGGRSSRSYRDEGWWEKCLALKPDYLLIQFGHNDQPGKGSARESEHDGAFRDHLRKYIDEAKLAGVQPILITSLTRRMWNHEGRIEPTLADYAAATSIVAQEKSVPLIDLHRSSIAHCEQLGPEAYRIFEPMKPEGADHTHLNLEGSRAVAPLIVEELLRKLPEIAPYFSNEKIAAARSPQPHRSQITNGHFELEESDSTIAIRSRNQTLLVYNKQSPSVPKGMNPRYQRSGFLHPIASPEGRVVTASFPVDHPHQQGIFSAWVKTRWRDREIDFWNLGDGTGRVLHQRVVATGTVDDKVYFEVDLVHRSEQSPVVDILRERWRVTAVATDKTYHAFELETTQQALSDIPLIIAEYHYGGVAVRGPVEWLSPDKKPASAKIATPCSMTNDAGSDRIQGNHEHAKWVVMSGESSGHPVSIAMLSHPSNFRAPQAARLHPTKPYFVYSPCVDGEFRIDRHHPYQARYLFLVTDRFAEPAWLNQRWNEWTAATP